jgi:HEPN domain-containing protein
MKSSYGRCGWFLVELTRKEEVDQFYRRSSEFLQSSELQMSRQLFSLAVFSMEQSLQLSLKGRLLEEGADFPRTHSVRKLLKLLSELAEDDERRKELEELSMQYTLELGILEDAYITSRYGVREFEKEEAERIQAVVKAILDGIKKKKSGHC